MWYLQTLPSMCPDDKLGVVLALYEAGTLTVSEAAHTVLTVVGGEGARLSSPLPEPLVRELWSLLSSARGRELAALHPARYLSLSAYCSGQVPGQGSGA